MQRQATCEHDLQLTAEQQRITARQAAFKKMQGIPCFLLIGLG